MSAAPTPMTILVVEDEPKLARLLIDYLEASGFRHHWLANGLEVVSWVRAHPPDLILLDLMLPGRDGMELCRDIREFSAVPIIMVTARVEEVDRLLGLDLGADDYICKPFSPREVIVRIKAIQRRLEWQLSPGPPSWGLEIDADRFEIRLAGQPLNLTGTEFRMLSLMAATPGRVYSRDRLLDCLHEDNLSVSDRTVDSHIKNIRRKLAQIAPEREVIMSVYGVGYKVEV